METELIKRVIKDQEEEVLSKFNAERIIDREYSTEIQRHITKTNAVVITGVRRSGKSTEALLLVKGKRHVHLNFDDPSLEGMKGPDLVKVTEAMTELKGNVEYIILDEIQNVKGWELYVSRLRETKKVIVTGSNSELMSEELASRLTGRYTSFTAFPFSFREFLDYNRFKPDVYLTNDIAKTRGFLDKYMLRGGFPEALALGERFLTQIYSDIITKDIERRYSIKHRSTFREFSKYVVSNISKEMSYNKLKNIFEIKSVHTVKNYLGFLEKAYIAFKVDKYSNKLKQQVLTGKKVYCIDTGLANALGFRIDEEKGRLLENVIAIELLRRKSYWNIHTEIYFWQDYKQHEVDFVVKESGSIKQLIQVSYRIEESDTKEREIRSLLAASKELRCNNLLIITYDFEGEEEKDGKKIIFMPAWKWLLLASGSS